MGVVPNKENGYQGCEFENGDIKTKREIIGSIYPEKIQFTENAYRTTRINETVAMITTLEATLKGYKKRTDCDFASLSKEVIPFGFFSGSLRFDL